MTEDQGSITFWLQNPQNADWTEDDSTGDFGTVSKAGISVEAIKNPDRTIALKVAGVLDRDFEFRQPIPKNGPSLFVAITWGNQEVRLYLNDKLVETRQVE